MRLIGHLMVTFSIRGKVKEWKDVHDPHVPMAMWVGVALVRVGDSRENPNLGKMVAQAWTCSRNIEAVNCVTRLWRRESELGFTNMQELVGTKMWSRCTRSAVSRASRLHNCQGRCSWPIEYEVRGVSGVVGAAEAFGSLQ